ncbi:TRAP dicarboxylate transporter- DctP subunit [Dinoroseobacter shibae DFL 12 = DSM 16493]|jgi:C4-dicarboxylate-binding protein DctP|uniref:TRAP dicarboxylate transporter-DctP subunit n=1 Tax=Dinoroseobacter shibae (strain DSM 16493 / NCIMB 14021 / DFL 12) TaxID=398580 RepID=A8LHN4_DINSH|nr:TRAP transporter substrate-binding protein DctP [Dinoroseobacter shibae]ABV92831.1 TRAP dicarboxylate transporter- DctP subunit [Dinoroseobacter shibae DFL 12 = DSM 16493]URF47770.1 TRAP transporter substrate-binding protein DctP [Dinoroseobacter shibae]URF52080.1 TRAP transporter substrate-binding protein DctP [Dinoroseobacter shibae]
MIRDTLILAACASVIGSAALATEKMRISLQLPLTSHLGENLQLFEKEVEERTGGAIDVEIYDSATLYRDKEVPAAVGSGAIEAGVASLTQYVGDAPVVDVFYMPFLFNTEEKVRAAVAEGSPVREILETEIAKTGGEVLYWQAYGGAILLSQDEPIRTPEDMQGKKARVFGKTLGDFVTAAGGAPTLISGSEQYLAYQRGTVDVGMTGVSGVKSRKLWEVMDTITKTNHANIEFVVVVNSDWWNGLDAETQGHINAAAQVAQDDVRDRMAAIEAEAYAAAEENGMTIVELTDEELAKWQAVSQPVYDSYLAATGEAGRQILDALGVNSGS